MVIKLTSLHDMRTHFTPITTEPTSKVEYKDGSKLHDSNLHSFTTRGDVAVLYKFLAWGSQTGKHYEMVPISKEKKKFH